MRSKLAVLSFAILLSYPAWAAATELTNLRESYDYYEARGYYAIAESLATRQLELARTLYAEPHREIADALLELGLACLYLEAYPRADSLLHASLEMRRAIYGDEHIEIAEGLEALSELNVWRSNPNEAERLAREALAIRIAVLGEDHVDVAPAYLCLGVALSDKGSHDESEQVLRKALERFETSGDSLKVADTLQRMFLWSHPLEERVQAEVLTRRALRIYRSELGEESARVAQSLSNLGEIYYNRDPVMSEQLHREALAMRLKVLGEGHRLVRLARHNVAVVMGTLGRLEEAEAQYRKIIRSVESKFDPEHGQLHPLYYNLGGALLKQGRLDEAIAVYDHTLELRRAAYGDDYFVSHTLDCKAWALFEQKRYDDAETIWVDLLTRREDEYGPTNRFSVRTLEFLGLIQWSRGDMPKAESYFEQSAAMYEQVRLMVARGFGSSIRSISPYERLAAVRLELGDNTGAWEAVERIRGLTLSELLAACEARQLNDDEDAEEASLARAMSDAEATLVGAIKMSRDDPTPAHESAVAAARIDLTEAQGRWDEFQADIALRYPVTEGLNYTLEDIQSSLSPHTAIVGWLDADRDDGQVRASNIRTVSWTYVIRDHGHVQWERLGETERVFAEPNPARAMYDLIMEHGRSAFVGEEERMALEPKAKELWHARFERVERYLDGVQEIVVIPSRGMSGLPLECLMDDDGVWIGERFSVSYAPSATVAAWLRTRELPVKARATTALLVGDPPYNDEQLVATEHSQVEVAASWNNERPNESILRGALDGNAEAIAELPRLVGSRREVEGVAPVFHDAQMLLGVDASERMIVELADRRELADFDVVHLATHALIDNSGPERSALVLSQVPSGGDNPAHAGIDGLVTAAEIARTWDLDAELVTLSACQTALGKTSAEGTIGLVSAFLQAGARCLLVSLWDADDKATALLMQRFYKTWVGSIEAGAPVTKAEALRQAQASLRSSGGANEPFDHPYFWSAFILVGDAR